MAHMIPQHPEMNIQGHPSHPTLQAALQIDPNHPPPHLQAHPPPSQASSRKRKKVEGENGEPSTPAEPRRLRRSHEACARCRSKKIKASPVGRHRPQIPVASPLICPFDHCVLIHVRERQCDSKHPRCTACASAGVQCQQEDRHKQALVDRGHTEHVERQLLLCTALLKRHIPNFDLNDLEAIAAREAIEIDQNDVNAVQAGGFAFTQNGSPRGFPPFPPHTQHMIPPPGYASHLPLPYGYPPPPHMMPPPGFHPHIHPGFQSPPQTQAPIPGASVQEPRGNEPLPNDLSSSEALAKAFGVSPAIVGDLKLAPAPIETEDVAVGLTGLISRRDNEMTQASAPRDPAKWISVPVIQGSPTSPVLSTTGTPKLVDAKPPMIWLPKERKMVQQVLDVYFTRLNIHRPVFTRSTFERNLDALYNGTASLDPGFLCSTYLILALGTLSELNDRVNKLPQEVAFGSSTLQKVMPLDWPQHEEFFGLALAVKPELRVTISSLQALILLHWYLYTERQGRTLWRLVGSFVRLAIELGLHHDPTTFQTEDAQNPGQSLPPVFSEEECQLRIRLWGIIVLHDRGTSILLGRPLAIAPYDSNTPRPSAGKGDGVSEHFILSSPIVEIQADIINSLYAPTRQSADSILRHAQRIMKSIQSFIRQLPDSYKLYFQGTGDWPYDRRHKLVENITEDQGLTLLKIGISRILLLRALFSSKELPYGSRQRSLMDAIVTSHNIIVVHQQLIKFPDIAFFVSPIPLHIAAMVILYGHMSKCGTLAQNVALEDVWMALQMLPKFRWRWERKDLKGGHPLIAKLAEQVLKVSLDKVAPTTPPMLMPESPWDTESVLSPKSHPTMPTTPTMGPAQYSPMSYGKSSPTSGPPTGPGKDSGAQENGRDEKLAEVPSGLFYPFFPESAGASTTSLLGSQPMGNYGYQPSQHSYVLEEKDPSLVQTTGPGIPMWHPGNQHDPRAMAPYQGPPHI
ncbi:fungal-specific transcription factor domain-containing protein [Irpex rosettiformis]|uniref:Fungal-specific transcription factor domain-containing protein n=1 Tax=Irpex rosettiformis TaxID=378272 RepID=A0ACB8U7V6_9APHY|nr:fungal-specific transcription factor domain-containing protein [Irpex rosettiformis]